MISSRTFAVPILALCLPSWGLAGGQAAPIQVQFGERVELGSVIFYLAGNKEYSK